MKQRNFIAGLALSFFVYAITTPVSNAQDQPKRGGTLTFSTRKDLTMMNPLVRTSSTDKALRGLMYESLLDMDLKGNIRPNLAESWEVSKDGTVYTFHLRKGVKFHNGQEMTADDAKFAIDYTKNPKNAAYGFSRLALVDRAETVDKHTLKIYLKKASPGFLSLLANIQTSTYGPDFVCPLNLKKRAANTTGYCDKEMDALIRQAEIELNPEKRREVFQKIVTKVIEDLPDIPIGYTPRLFMFGDHVKGFTTNSEGHFRHYGGGLNYTWLDK